MQSSSTSKKCRSCRTVLPKSDFYWLKGNPNEYPECRGCHRTRNKNWYERKKKGLVKTSEPERSPLSWIIKQHVQRIFEWMRDARLFELKILLEGIGKPKSENPILQVKRRPGEDYFHCELINHEFPRVGRFSVKGLSEFLAARDLTISKNMLKRIGAMT